MNPWMTVLLAVVSSGVVGTIVTAIASRRNLGATTTRTEAEAHRTDAETDRIIAETRRATFADFNATIDRLTARINDLELAAEDQRRVLILHAAWDLMAVAKVREAVPPIDLPHPPPLTPPVRRRTEP